MSETEIRWGGEVNSGSSLSYTFDGTNGVMKDSQDEFNFKIVGSTLIVYNGDESTFIKQ